MQSFLEQGFQDLQSNELVENTLWPALTQKGRAGVTLLGLWLTSGNKRCWLLGSALGKRNSSSSSLLGEGG